MLCGSFNCGTQLFGPKPPIPALQRTDGSVATLPLASAAERHYRWADQGMSKYEREIAARGPVWAWLVSSGPHGSSFEWGQTPQAPREFRELDLLRQLVAERAAVDPSFSLAARKAALELLAGAEVDYIRRAIQVLSVVAAAEDVDVIRKFLRHRNADVRKDARACLFELRVLV